MNIIAKKPKMSIWIKILILLIPLTIFGYLIYSNFLVDQEFNYFYDIGSPEDKNKPFLTPLERMSDIYWEEDKSYRDINHQLSYFNVPVHQGAETIDIKFRFQNIFEDNQKILLGARDQGEWHYKWNQINITSGFEEWHIAETKFNISEVYLQNGILNIAFNIHHLDPNKTSGLPVPIDWINITVHKPALWRIDEILF